MYIERIPNRGSKPAVLLRESFRDGPQIRKRTLANLSRLPENIISKIQHAIKGHDLVPAGKEFQIERSLPHGHVRAIHAVMQRLGLPAILSARPCRERDLSLAMIAARIIHGSSKLATTRLWRTTTIGEIFKVADAVPAEAYRALDWLADRQPLIETKLGKRHLAGGRPA